MERISEIGFYASEDWTVEEFYNFFHQLNILYNRLYVLEQINENAENRARENKSVRNRKLDRALYGSLSAVEDEDCLSVRSIEIHSPGDFNLLGVDKVISQLRELWKDISYRNRQEEEREAEAQRHNKVMNQWEENSKKQEMLIKQITVMRQLGYDEEQVQLGVKALGDPLEQLYLISGEKKISTKDPYNSAK